jgi:archaellum biogenesis ATPase FlaH
MVYRCILADWAKSDRPELPKVLEGEFSNDQISAYNEQGYNIYFLPNYPSLYDSSSIVEGSDIDTFRFVFVDMDLKDGYWPDKEAFYCEVFDSNIEPSYIIDSGNGVHVYWQVEDLDAISFLRLQRRLCRRFHTDEAVSKIYQLMRVPGTLNTKKRDQKKLCEDIFTSDHIYTSEQLDKLLPQITQKDEDYCQQHYSKTYKIGLDDVKVDEKLPAKFAKLLSNNKEAKEIWACNTDDRSKSDYRLGHIMFASQFTKDEAMSVLINTAKAISRAPAHRIGYAQNIVEKIWTYELAEDKDGLNLSSSIAEILRKNGDSIKGVRFPCHKYLDDTYNGFRLGQVIGLVAGSGVGKTAMALNMFYGYVKSNPDYQHFFIPLEQPAREIADRWKAMCGDDTAAHEKVHVISNYDDSGAFRRLSLTEIKEYILKFQAVRKCKIGCIVIDHIGALKKTGKNGENQDIMDICHEMKGFAVETNTLLIMQSQSSREKAGIGDLELNKDAAYGTVYFESYCDYLITIWQPLKRCYMDYNNGKRCPTVMAFKFCKIRHKNINLDFIQEDVCYRLHFNPATELLREMTQDEERVFDYWAKIALNKRKFDRKTDLVPYKSTRKPLNEPGKTDSTKISQ